MISLIRMPTSPGSAADLKRLDLEFFGLIRRVNIRGVFFIGRTTRGTLSDLRKAEQRLHQLAERSPEERARDILEINTWIRRQQQHVRSLQEEKLRQEREGIISCSATVVDEGSGEEIICTNFVPKPRADRLIQDGLPITCHKCGERQAKEGKIRLFDGVDWQCK